MASIYLSKLGRWVAIGFCTMLASQYRVQMGLKICILSRKTSLTKLIKD